MNTSWFHHFPKVSGIKCGLAEVGGSFVQSAEGSVVKLVVDERIE
jgi:hypothetical protein